MRHILTAIAILAALSLSAATAKKKITDPDEALDLARQAFVAYDVATARDMFDQYEALLKKKKRAVPDDVEAEIGRLVMLENMLSRVERITVVDSLTVDADGFFRHYRLSPEAGRLVAGEAVHMPDVELAYVPQNNSQFLYADLDSLDNFVLMGADILDDGSVDRPEPLRGDDLAGGGNAEYPFMLSDGLTLYYASDGDGSLGGYDIFLTRRDDDGTYLQPQNVGMPFNSPYDDYLLAIDETTGLGWWATDRHQIPGKVTIYIYVPSDTRVNVDPDSPDLVSLARLDDIALTQQGADIAALKARIAAIGESGAARGAESATFELPVGSADRIYTRLSDFRSPQARRAMARAIDARAEVERIEARLYDLRKAWSEGNHDGGVTILNLEQQLDDARRRQQQATNEAIEAELR